MLSRLETLDITIWQFDPLRASSYHILPAWITKHATTDIRNTGNDFDIEDDKEIDEIYEDGIESNVSEQRKEWYTL